MAFYEIPKAKHKVPIATTVRASVVAKGVMSVSFPRDVWEALARPKRVKVMVGTGPDAGQFLLAPAPYSGVLVSRTGAGMRTVFGATMTGLTAFREPTRVVPHEITPDGLVITPPAEWFSAPATQPE